MQSTLSATAAAASQQASADADADAALGQQAQAHKKHLTTLFHGKKCKPGDSTSLRS